MYVCMYVSSTSVENAGGFKQTTDQTIIKIFTCDNKSSLISCKSQFNRICTLKLLQETR